MEINPRRLKKAVYIAALEALARNPMPEGSVCRIPGGSKVEIEGYATEAIENEIIGMGLLPKIKSGEGITAAQHDQAVRQAIRGGLVYADQWNIDVKKLRREMRKRLYSRS